MATSNFETARKTNLPKWRPSPRPEFAHIDLSEDGRCRNRITMQEYHRFHPSHTHKAYYVSPQPARVTGVKPKNIPVSVLVYEAFHNVILPPFTKVAHKNGVVTDDRIENLYLKGNAPHAVNPATITVLPTIIPEVHHSHEEQKLSAQEQRWIERYRQKIADAVIMLQCSSEITLQEIDDLALDEGDLVDVLMQMDTEQIAALITRLIALAHGDGMR